jgi:hypothetical protein
MGGVATLMDALKIPLSTFRQTPSAGVLRVGNQSRSMIGTLDHNVVPIS